MPDYDLNVGHWLADHPDYCLRIGCEGFGYMAQRRDEHGRGAGERYSALTLDELAVMLAKAETEA